MFFTCSRIPFVFPFWGIIFMCHLLILKLSNSFFYTDMEKFFTDLEEINVIKNVMLYFVNCFLKL